MLIVSRRLKCYVAFAAFYCLDNSLCVGGFILVKPGGLKPKYGSIEASKEWQFKEQVSGFPKL